MSWVSLLLLLFGRPRPLSTLRAKSTWTSCRSPCLQVPIAPHKGFVIKEYARVPDARSLAISPSDIVYVGNKFLGEVYAVMDKDNDKKGETVALLLSGLTTPNGIAFHLPTGNLVVAERSHVWYLGSHRQDDQ